ncbi:MAG: PLP-dependent aminotransferase family protein [Candidatus Limivivens sp.]|nr:PLP-dependent aminotransferase family protein [Candidatus Limivivens sp.]
MNEMTIGLDVKSDRPLYEQIYQFIKEEIQSGRLAFGERLPSTRKLSGHLQVSRSTVDMAYEQLLSEGYIESVPCRGYFVSELDGIYHLVPQKHTEGQEPPEQRERYLYDFSPNGVDLGSFPYNAWRKLSKNILMDDKKELFMLGAPAGEAVLQETIADYLYQARGVSCRPDQVIIGAGTDFLLMLLCSIWGSPRRIAMENPTYKRAYRVLKTLNNEMCSVSLDKNGMRMDELERSGADVAYVMPSHQYPLGTVMPMKRRMKLLSWAEAKPGRYIIEDDYDSEFRYKGKPIPSLQGFDRNGCVIYLGTFSKSIAPAIRVSYMVLPKTLMEDYRSRGSVFASTVSRVDQMIVAGFLREGYYERHLNKMRALYRGRHDALLEGLKEIPGIQIHGENAGVHLLVTFQNGMTEEEAIRRAGKAGIRVYGLSGYYTESGEGCYTENREGIPGETVILGYANLEEEEIRRAAGKLKEAWKKGPAPA